MDLRGDAVREQAGARAQNLVLGRRYHLVFSGHQRVEARLCHGGGVVLAGLSGARVHHLARLKKLVSVMLGISTVTVTPLSFNSLRSASPNQRRNTLVPP